MLHRGELASKVKSTNPSTVPTQLSTYILGNPYTVLLLFTFTNINIMMYYNSSNINTCNKEHRIHSWAIVISTDELDEKPINS